MAKYNRFSKPHDATRFAATPSGETIFASISRKRVTALQ